MEHIYLAELSFRDILLLLVIILLLFGSTKIPQVMRGLGRGVSEFKKGLKEGEKPDPDEEKKDDSTPKQGNQEIKNPDNK